MNDETPHKKNFIGPLTKLVAATCIGFGTGVLKFIGEIRGEYFENLRNSNHGKEIEEVHGQALHNLRTDKLHPDSQMSGDEYVKRHSKEKRAFYEDMDELSEKLGIRSVSKDVGGKLEVFTKGTMQRFRTLSENTRNPVVFNALTTTVIGFAGTYMFLNSMANRHAIKDLTEKAPSDKTIS